MLIARKPSIWRRQYEIEVHGRATVVWHSTFWRQGGTFHLNGHRYEVRGNAWGTQFGMVDSNGALVASAQRVGRKRWTLQAGGREHHFRRVSFWTDEQELLEAGQRVGSVRRMGFWRRSAVADLPTLPDPVQVFVVGVLLTMWEARDTAAAASS